MDTGVGLAWVARGLPAGAPWGFFEPGAAEGEAGAPRPELLGAVLPWEEGPRPALPGEEVPGTGVRAPPGGETAAEGGRGLLGVSTVAGAASGAGSGSWGPGPGEVGKLPERVSPQGVSAQPESPTANDRAAALANRWRRLALTFPPVLACKRRMLIRFPPDE